MKETEEDKVYQDFIDGMSYVLQQSTIGSHLKKDRDSRLEIFCYGTSSYVSIRSDGKRFWLFSYKTGKYYLGWYNSKMINRIKKRL